MTQPYRDTRKIDPTKGALLPDGTPNDNNRVEIGPTQLAFGEWQAAGLTLPNLQKMREFRWKRLTQHVVERGLGGLLRLTGRGPLSPAGIWCRKISTSCKSTATNTC